MNVMERFTLRSMKANRKWTVVTLIGIIISTAMLAAVSTFISSFTELMKNEALADNGNWHAMFVGVPAKDVQIIEEASFVGSLSCSRDVGYAVLPESENKNKPYLFVEELDEASAQTFPLKLVEGRMPANENELALPEHLSTNGGVDYHVGDQLTLQLGTRKDASGNVLGQDVAYEEDVTYEDGEHGEAESFHPEQTRTYTVVGIIERPNFEPSWAPGYTAISLLNAQSLQPDDALNVTMLAKKLNHGLFDDVSALAQRLNLDDNHVQYNTELLRYSGIVMNGGMQNAIYGFAIIFIVIILIASVSLIYNAFAISVAERVTQLGMLASVGATRRQKRQSIYFEGFLLGLAGIPLGIVTGIVGIGVTLSAIRPLMDSFSNFSSQGLILHVSGLSIVTAAGLAALTILISVWIPARRASKIMPIDAIRQSKEVKLTRKTVKTSRLTRLLFGFEGELALKNLKRSRKKYRATVLSLIISLVLFLTVAYYAQEMNQTSGTVEDGYNFNLSVTYTNLPSDQTQGLNEKIAVLDSIAETSALEETSLVFRADMTQLSDATKQQLYGSASADPYLGLELFAMDDAALDRYAQSLGVDPAAYRDPKNPKMIVINFGRSYFNDKYLAGEILTINAGVPLRLARDVEKLDAGEDCATLEVGLLTDQRPLGVMVTSMTNPVAVVSRTVFDGLPDELKAIDSNGNPSISRLYIRCDDADEVEIQVQKLLEDVTDNSYILNLNAVARREQNMMVVLGVFIYGFITLISLICIANIFNTVTTNIALRRREFAMLRSVGMTPGGFNQMIRFESIFYGLKALLYGLPISVGISLLLHNISSQAFDFKFVLPWRSYLAAIVLIFIIVGSTMLYSSSKIKKENIIDALKSDYR